MTKIRNEDKNKSIFLAKIVLKIKKRLEYQKITLAFLDIKCYNKVTKV